MAVKYQQHMKKKVLSLFKRVKPGNKGEKMKKNNVIEINFKTKRRRNRKLEEIIDETFKRSTGEIRDNNHLLPPGPNCLDEDDLIIHIKTSLQYEHPKMFEDYKKNDEHIFLSCKRCRSLFFKVSEKLAERPISELL